MRLILHVSVALVGLTFLLLFGAACSATHASAGASSATSAAISGKAAAATGIARTGKTPTPLPAYPCEAQATCTCSDFPSRPEAARVYAKHGGHGWSGMSADAYGIVCDHLP